ncbi:MAG: hypothetical protein ABL999_03040 [Pyrinomonadaceae bacterium]
MRQRSIVRRNNLNLVIAAIFVLIVGLACGKSTPPPPQYVGVWKAADGTLITIRADGGADYKSGNYSVSGGSAVIDEAAKTLKISLASLGPTFKIDKPPTGSEMTLDGILFRKDGGSSSSSDDKPTSNAKGEIPSNDKLQTLVKSTFLDFSDAVQSGDFTDFHKKAAKVWRDDATPDELAEAFKPFVDDKENYNFKKAVSPMDATFSPAPSIEKVAGLDALVVKGYYPTKPARANFELKYTMDDGTWKLIGINVKTTRE